MNFILVLLLAGQAVSSSAISGVVRDSSGQGVPNVTVIARFVSGAEQRALTAADGRFTLPVAVPGDIVLIARAPAFAELRQTLASGAAAADVVLVLQPASFSEIVTVTASRMEQRLRDVPASISVLTQEDIRRSP